MAPEDNVLKSERALSKNVLKVTCFGSDFTSNGSDYGRCHHPCHARGACGYPSHPDDVERYDTTITIPTVTDAIINDLLNLLESKNWKLHLAMVRQHK